MGNERKTHSKLRFSSKKNINAKLLVYLQHINIMSIDVLHTISTIVFRSWRMHIGYGVG